MEIKVFNKNVYGNNLIYPACKQAELFARLLNKKSFSITELGIIMQLGYTVTTVPEPVTSLN